MNIKIKKYIKPVVFLFFVLSFAFLPLAFAEAAVECNKGEMLCQGASGPDVGELQEKLKAALSLSSLAIDCSFGPGTFDAVKAYQTTQHLTIDGKAGPQTLAKLEMKTSDLVSTGPTGPNCMSGGGNGTCDPDTNVGCSATQYCRVDGNCAALKGPGADCEGNYECASALVCPNGRCIAPGTATCTPACNPDTQTCTNGACVAKTTNPPPGNSGNCGDPSLEPLNGLCLPKSNFGGLGGTRTWQELTKKIIDILLTISGVIAVLFILIGGFWYITSAGNEEQAEKGKKALINAIIGLVVVILSFVIISVVANMLTK